MVTVNKHALTSTARLIVQFINFHYIWHSATFKPKIVGGRSPLSFPSLPFLLSLPYSLSLHFLFFSPLPLFTPTLYSPHFPIYHITILFISFEIIIIIFQYDYLITYQIV